jgi:FMN-dependent NADH-azoreductase
MSVLLHVDCSPFPAATTRLLANGFVEAWRARNPAVSVVTRDIGMQPVPHVSAAFAESIFTPPEQHSAAMRDAAAYANELTMEFLAASRYVISMPMRILNVPSTFKAYVEHIFHRDKVFKVTSTGYEGLLAGRKVMCITARGGDYRAGSTMQRYDIQEPYLRALFEFCGVRTEDVDVVNADAMFSELTTREDMIAKTRARLFELAAAW